VVILLRRFVPLTVRRIERTIRVMLDSGALTAASAGLAIEFLPARGNPRL
jgi:hypothetical protein